MDKAHHQKADCHRLIIDLITKINASLSPRSRGWSRVFTEAHKWEFLLLSSSLIFILTFCSVYCFLLSFYNTLVLCICACLLGFLFRQKKREKKQNTATKWVMCSCVGVCEPVCGLLSTGECLENRFLWRWRHQSNTDLAINLDVTVITKSL